MNLKTFSQQSRRILIKGVAQKLLYWGFESKGKVLEFPEAIPGGFIFRGEAFDDPTVPGKWNALRSAIQKKGIETVVEEAAYTWFNRMMAIRILSKNKYDMAQLENEGESFSPLILVRARRSQPDFLGTAENARLKNTLTDYNRDKESFAILLTGYCDHHTLLKSIFGKLDDYTELLLPDDILEKEGFLYLLNRSDAISDEDYQKVELIGWLYQFYISERKDEVFASFKKNKKAEAKDIPAATQIFTPNWIVKYMVQNTVGKLWLDLNPASPLKADMKYLVHDDAQKQAPIIREVSQLKLLDPAVGSGHILVEGFDTLYAMYKEEYYTDEEAVKSILDHNLFGLDIDLRAAQLAKFAVLLKAAKRYPEVLQRGWMPQIHAMPEPYDFSRQEILDFLGKEGLVHEDELTIALSLMQDAQNLGSAMVFGISIETSDYLNRRMIALEKEQFSNLTTQLLLLKIKPYFSVISLLTKKYEAVSANPPYMGSGTMNEGLKEYAAKYYPETKSDLMTIFMEVVPNLTKERGKFAMINLPSWLFLSSFEKLRANYLLNYKFDSLLHMGRGIFGIDFGSVAFSMSKTSSENGTGNYFRLHERNFQHIYFEDIEKLFLYSNGNPEYKYDFTQYRGEEGITEIPIKGTKVGLRLYYPNITQTNFSKIPGSPVAYWVSISFVNNFDNPKIGELLSPKKGLVTMNDKMFVKLWHEVNFLKIGFGKKNKVDFEKSDKKYAPYKNGGGYRRWYGNRDAVINWKHDGLELKNYIVEKSGDHYSRQIINQDKYFLKSISWNSISSSKSSFRYYEDGFIFGSSGPSMFPKNTDYYDIGFLNSKILDEIVKAINPTFNYGPKVIGSVPYLYDSLNFDIVSQLAALAIHKSKLDWDSRETSWDLEKSPLLNYSLSLNKAYHNWEESVTEDFFELHAYEEELNRIFIDIYGLQDELTPQVPLKEITIHQEEIDTKKLEKMENGFREIGIGWEAKEKGLPVVPEGVMLPIKKDVVMKQLISYVIGLNMGRYRLDNPGLNIAHPDPSEAELSGYHHNGFEVVIDEDGIIPLMGSACLFPDDAFQRLKYFMEVVWGTESLTENLNFLQECMDEDLESYLVKNYWKDHCKTYKKKPIYWLFSSDKGAFQVLTYMHRMNPFTVEKIRSNYLLPHLQHLNSQIDRLESSKEDPRLLDKLTKNLQECEAYDLLLKDTADQQILFDLDDGVTKNYELFGDVVRKVK